MKKNSDGYFGKGNAPPPYSILGLPLEIKSDDVSDEGKFKGWGSTFGGKPDSYGDVVVKGAFKETLENGGRNGTGIAMLYQHNSYEPIGVWTVMEERDKGLWVEGELDLNVQRAKETHSLLRKGAMRGLSIGYDLPRNPDGSRDTDAVEYLEQPNGQYIRLLKKINLWEVSPVTFPANIRATITSVKDFEGCKTERDWERTLRELGLSKSAAQYIVKLIKPSLRESGAQDESQDELGAMLAELRDRNKRACDF